MRMTRRIGRASVHWLAIAFTLFSLLAGSSSVVVLNGQRITCASGTVTWNGASGVDNKWTTGGNWVGGTAPCANADLVFPSSATQFTAVNDFANGTGFNSLSFAESGYAISGNDLTLPAGTTGLSESVSGAGTNTLSLNIVLGGDQTFNVTGGGTLVIDGVISGGTSNLTKTGSGTLEFSGSSANTYTGTTTVTGRLLLNKTAGVDAIAGPLVVLGTNSLIDRVTVAASEQINDSVPVTLTDAGFDLLNGSTETLGAPTALTLHGYGEIFGGLSDTTLRLGGNVISDATGISFFTVGKLDLGSATRTFTIGLGTGSREVQIDDPVIGDPGVGIIKNGPGRLLMNAANTYTGPTSIDAGTLIVDGSSASSTHHLNGGTLAGDNGTVGPVSTVTGGTLSPGFSPGNPGRLSAGDTSLGSSVAYDYEIGGTSGPGNCVTCNDELDVTGTVNLTNPVLSVSEINAFTSATGNSFTLINNDSSDAVTGTFAGLPEGAQLQVNGRLLQISYVGGTGNDVVLTDAGPVPASGGGGGPSPDPMTRVFGSDRILTAIAVSKDSFPTDGSAHAVVLSRSDGFADALAGTPLAVAKHAPLLLTPSASGIDARTLAEIKRVLALGKTVYLLGGPVALDPSVDTALRQAGFTVVRYQGPNRFATAVSIAHDGLNDPPTVLLATGTDFADALAGGAAAANVPGGAAILLTNGSAMASDTSTYMAAHPPTKTYGLGGPAASADPNATGIVGVDRFETAVMVAKTFFTDPTSVGLAFAFNFPDALAGGTHIGAKHGPLLLTDTNSLSATVSSYLAANKTSVSSGYAYGGSAVLSNGVLSAAQGAYA